MVTQETSLISAWSATGLVVSGVLAAHSRWTSSGRINSLATSAARFGFDWLSLTTISTSRLLPPASTLPPIASSTAATLNSSSSAKGASGPVLGPT